MTLKYKDLEKRKRERQMARRKDGRTTDAKQARMHGRITAVCVESASPSLTHGEQPGGNVVQDGLLRRTNSLCTRFWCAGLSYLIVKPCTLVEGRECTRTGATAPCSTGEPKQECRQWRSCLWSARKLDATALPARSTRQPAST